ncbi:MAG: amidohydrolase [Acholeplasmatales bacterium]|nr:MAG: amidohydrolase [Acholeplasmatales bacterium]
MPIAITDVTLYDFEQFIEDGYIVFDETILEVGRMADFKAGDNTCIDGRGHWVMPGLVCGHTHIYATFARGLALPFNPVDFQDILDQLWWKVDRHLTLESIYQSGLVSGMDFLKNGITTVIDHHASGEVKGALKQLQRALTETLPMRAVLAFETSDRFDVASAIAENTQAIEQQVPTKMAALFGLHASMSLSESTLKAVKAVLGDHPIHIHVAESSLDQQQALHHYGERVVERLDRHGLLNPGSILTHAIHVDDHELKRIQERGCVIAVNVSSNMNNSVGLPDIPAFLNLDIPVILGNDGLSFGMAHEYLNLVYAMHHKKNSPTSLDLGDLQRMIRQTYTYASERLGIELGVLRQDAAADLLMIPYTAPTPLDETNAFGHLFYGLFNAFKPKHVFTSGKQVVRDYDLSDAHQKLYAEAKHEAEKLWNRIREEAE